MKRAHGLLLALTFTVFACSDSGSGPSNENATPALSTDGGSTGTTTTTTPVQDSTTVPKAALTFSTNVDLINTTALQEDKLNKAIEIVKLVVATEEFRTQILNHVYKGVKTFADNRGMSNEEIYQSILDAAETLRPSKNNIMDLGVELYYAATTVVGYTYPTVTQIWVNTKFFDTYTPAGVAHNLMHEWLHKLGYDHDSASTPARPYSVPYAIGYIVAEIGKDFL